MAAVIGATSVFVYIRVDRALLGSVDQTLRAQAGEAAQRTHDERALVDPDVAGGQTLAQLLDANGRVTRSTPATLPSMLGASDAARAARGARFFRSVRLRAPAGRWRVLSVPLRNGGAIVLARSLAAHDEALHRLAREFAIVGPLAVLLAALAGYALAAAALRPVETMRRRAARVTADSAALLPVPRARDEISRLAITLNDMLSRLHGALEHERRFVADASHELRTPIALLRTELELALRRPRSAEELKGALRSALDETERLSRLADDLLLLARGEEGSLPLRRERTELAPLFDNVTRRFGARARAAGRAVRAHETAAVLDADSLRVEQALDNLVDNALAYGGGDVVLVAATNNGLVEVHVMDHGGGFDEAFIDRAFERFSRADEARRWGGAGLGLSIVQLIATAHGGAVGAGNRPCGGADVWLSLPKAHS
jgi:signal transduction histidine kinase